MNTLHLDVIVNTHTVGGSFYHNPQNPMTQKKYVRHNSFLWQFVKFYGVHKIKSIVGGFNFEPVSNLT